VVCTTILLKYVVSGCNSLFYRNVLTSVMAYHEHYILVQQKPDVLAAFTNSALHWTVWSEFMSQTSKVVFLDISIVRIFQFVFSCLCSVF